MEIIIGIGIFIIIFSILLLSKLLAYKDYTEAKFKNRIPGRVLNYKIKPLAKSKEEEKAQKANEAKGKNHTIILTDSGLQKINVMKELRAFTDIDLKSAKDIVDIPNSRFTVFSTENEIIEFINRLKHYGATALMEETKNLKQANQDIKGSELELCEFILVQAGSKPIDAIKEIRDFTGLGLKESKELVDNKNSLISVKTTQTKADSFIIKMKELGAEIKRI